MISVIIPTNCVVTHCASSVGDGARVYSGNPLDFECSKGVSTSSSLADGPGTILNLNSDGKSVRTSILARQSCNNSVHY
jgi:hypothetical protein